MEEQGIRDWTEVDCHHAYECFNGCRYGKGCWEDELSSACGSKPWSDCYCMTNKERKMIVDDNN